MTSEKAWEKIQKLMIIFDEEGDGSTDKLKELLLSDQDKENLKKV